MRPFRFSLQVHQAGSRREWVDLVRRAEDAGFDLIVTADHVGGCLDPLIPLATAAEVARRIRLGVMVLNNDLHHPALLARSAATLDLLSEGRLELGIGAGHAWPEYEAAGIAFDPPGTRVSRLAESVALIRRLLDGETVTHRGAHYHLQGEACDPRPVQAHVPILIGGGGDRVLGIAARLADGVGFTGLGRTLADGHRHETTGFAPERVDGQVAAVRAAAGARLPGLELQVLVQAVAVTGDPRRAAAEVAGRLPSVREEDVLACPYLLVGTLDSLAERLVAQRERWGFSHYTVRPEAFGQIEPLIARLSGR